MSGGQRLALAPPLQKPLPCISAEDAAIVYGPKTSGWRLLGTPFFLHVQPEMSSCSRIQIFTVVKKHAGNASAFCQLFLDVRKSWLTDCFMNVHIGQYSCCALCHAHFFSRYLA